MIRLAVVVLAATLAAGAACAQSGDGVWPNRPVHFVVPFAAGGSTAMVSQGVDSETSTPEALTGRVRDELGKWREVINKADIKAE